ncbi:hypothetical protein M0R45_007119 [Rubus argutus]|uniref:Uncharacterized protein n=1 Tax=Rubus argutus TaxID=59490 RepID=A0AAW1YSW3_RUBAR
MDVPKPRHRARICSAACPSLSPAIPTVTQAPPCFTQSRAVELSSPPSPSQLSRTRPSLPWTRAQPVLSSTIIQAQTRVLTQARRHFCSVPSHVASSPSSSAFAANTATSAPSINSFALPFRLCSQPPERGVKLLGFEKRRRLRGNDEAMVTVGRDVFGFGFGCMIEKAERLG